jgi:hypothetical protein
MRQACLAAHPGRHARAGAGRETGAEDDPCAHLRRNPRAPRCLASRPPPRPDRDRPRLARRPVVRVPLDVPPRHRHFVAELLAPDSDRSQREPGDGPASPRSAHLAVLLLRAKAAKSCSNPSACRSRLRRSIPQRIPVTVSALIRFLAAPRECGVMVRYRAGVPSRDRTRVDPMPRLSLSLSQCFPLSPISRDRPYPETRIEATMTKDFVRAGSRGAIANIGVLEV